MGFRFVVIVVTAYCMGAVAQTPAGIDCNRNRSLCEIEVLGQNLSMGMPQAQVLGLLKSHISENSVWSAEHKPDSLWYVTDSKNGTANAMIGGVKFKDEKLDGAMVLWSPDSSKQSDFGASLINLLERLSKEGSTHCILSTARTPRPQQEDSEAVLECGMRSVSVELSRFQSSFKGQKMQDYVAIQEMLGNW